MEVPDRTSTIIKQAMTTPGPHICLLGRIADISKTSSYKHYGSFCKSTIKHALESWPGQRLTRRRHARTIIRRGVAPMKINDVALLWRRGSS